MNFYSCLWIFFLKTSVMSRLWLIGLIEFSAKNSGKFCRIFQKIWFFFLKKSVEFFYRIRQKILPNLAENSAENLPKICTNFLQNFKAEFLAEFFRYFCRIIPNFLTNLSYILQIFLRSINIKLNKRSKKIWNFIQLRIIFLSLLQKEKY